MNNVKIGKIVEGTVFQVTDDVCYVDIQAFADGKIYKNGLSLTPIDSCKEVVKEGEILKFRVTKIDHDNQSILLSRMDMLREENRGKFDEETKHNEKIEAKVTKVTRGGLLLRYMDVEVFMPISHIDIKQIDPEDFKGKTLTCKVIENDERRIVVSRKLVLIEDIKKAKKVEFETLQVGDKHEGVVTRVLDFGAFVKIGANEGLLHRSEISHHRINKASDVLKENDKVTVEIISKEKNKLGLSTKRLQKAPWDIFAEEHKVGDEVEGKIVRKMATGMLVEVERDVVGIINSKDYSWNPRENLAGTVEVNDKLKLKILSLDVQKKRMSLSKKHLDYNPWNDVSVRVNEEVSGTVEEIQTRGALVKVQGVKAFLPIQEISSERINSVGDALKVDDVINAVILEVDKRQWRMKISMKALLEQKERAIFSKYKETEEKVKTQTLGDLFKDKFDEFK
jgi:small subunit ribosomal protein S1